jgi:plasmid stabilization system protein ParE
MPHVRLSQRAQRDLPRLYRFLAEFDPVRASQAIDTILAAFDTLHMPGIGAPVADKPGLRKLVIDFGAKGYTALYRYHVKTDSIVVVAVKHQSEGDYK